MPPPYEPLLRIPIPDPPLDFRPFIDALNPYPHALSLTNGMNTLIDATNDIREQLTATSNDNRVIIDAVANINRQLALMPMKMANASASNSAPMTYPPGTFVNGLLPFMKGEAMSLNGEEALLTLQALGIQVGDIPATLGECISYFRAYVGLV